MNTSSAELVVAAHKLRSLIRPTMYLLAGGACLLGAVGCSTSPPEPEPATRSNPRALVATGQETPVQALADFPLAALQSVDRTPAANTFIGSGGTIVQYKNSGGVIAWSRPDAPQMGLGWPSDKETHAQMVRGFILAHGVPAEELGAVYNFVGSHDGAPIAEPANVTHKHLGFASVYHRVVSGVDVPDSHAGAQLNSAGVAVNVAINWPEIPSATLADALDLKARIGAAWRLPEERANGLKQTRSRVVIRHSLPGSTTVLAWRAAIRTELSGQRRSHVDTDEFGNRIVGFDPSADVISDQTK